MKREGKHGKAMKSKETYRNKSNPITPQLPPHSSPITQPKFNALRAVRRPVCPKMAPKWLKMAPERPKMAPRWPQDGPRWPPGGPKMVRRWAKMAPTWPQDGTRWPQMDPRWPKMALDGPGKAQEPQRRTLLKVVVTFFGPKMAPRWAQNGPKMAPRWPQDGPRWPQDGPKMAPRWPQDSPKMALKGSS